MVLHDHLPQLLVSLCRISKFSQLDYAQVFLSVEANQSVHI
jgi:hypothetical protein